MAGEVLFWWRACLFFNNVTGNEGKRLALADDTPRAVWLSDTPLIEARDGR